MYLIYFLTYPVGLGPGRASIALLSGQIADGIATNVVGILIDKTNTRIGKKKPWYIFGFLLVLPTFILTFNTCAICDLVCNHNEEGRPDCPALEMSYFTILPALFNIGWAAVQIATMSIVVGITFSQTRRDRLISLRNGFTYVANLFTLVVAIVFILLVDNPIWTFRLLAYSLSIIGAALSLMFIFFIPEVKLTDEAIIYDKAYRKANDIREENQEGGENRKSVSEEITSWTQWLTSGAFYIHAGVYTFARMSVNVTMTLTPFYLIHVLKFETSEDQPIPPQIATVPLASYTTSMIFSLVFYNKLVRAFGNRIWPLLIGVIITCLASVPFLFMKPSFSWLVYIAASFQGVGLSIMLNIATSLISDVIGDDDSSSAFVYGAYSLCDKFVSGALLVVIGNTVIEDHTWLIWLSSVMVIGSALLTFICAFLGQKLYGDKLRGVSIQR